MRAFATPSMRSLAALTAVCLAASASLALADKQPAQSVIPACFLLSSSDAEAAVQQGLAAAKEGKTAALLLEDVRRQPSWTAKRKGPARGCSVWFTSLGGAYLRLRGLRSWEESKDDNLRELLPKDGTMIDHLDFVVLLKSVPQSARSLLDDTADSADVRVVRFEISDDRGNRIVVMPGPAPNLRPDDLDNTRSQDPDSFGGLRTQQREEVLYTLPSQQFTTISTLPHLESRYMIR